MRGGYYCVRRLSPMMARRRGRRDAGRHRFGQSRESGKSISWRGVQAAAAAPGTRSCNRSFQELDPFQVGGPLAVGFAMRRIDSYADARYGRDVVTAETLAELLAKIDVGDERLVGPWMSDADVSAGLFVVRADLGLLEAIGTVLAEEKAYKIRAGTNNSPIGSFSWPKNTWTRIASLSTPRSDDAPSG